MTRCCLKIELTAGCPDTPKYAMNMKNILNYFLRGQNDCNNR